MPNLNTSDKRCHVSLNKRNNSVELPKIHDRLRENMQSKKANLPPLSLEVPKVQTNLQENPIIAKAAINESGSAQIIPPVISDELLSKVKGKDIALYNSIALLNPHQQQAVLTNHTKVLVNAMVGSGKTTVLVHKVLYLHFIEEIAFDRMAVLTFTNKAANEIRDRILAYYIARGFSNPPQLPYVGTFHAVARNILTQSALLPDFGFTSEFTILDENERQDFYLRLAFDNGLDIKYVSKINKRIEKFIASTEAGVAPENAALYGNMKYPDDLSKLIVLAADAKRNSNVMDFDDLILMVNKVLRSSPNICKMNWVVVDEFQDCNRQQIEMLQNMMDSNSSIFAVGDPNQLIYEWRGSNSSHFDNFRSQDCTEYHLPKNYRSTTSILDIAKHLLIQSGTFLEGTREVGPPVVLMNHYDSSQEAIYLVNEIKRLQAEGISLREIAILVRTRRQIEMFETVFEKNDIPFQVADRKTLRDIPVLVWFVKLLKSCINVRDGKTFLDCLSNERYGALIPGVARQICSASIGGRKGYPHFDLDCVVKKVNEHYGELPTTLDLLLARAKEFPQFIEKQTHEVIPKLNDYFLLDQYLRPTSAHYAADMSLVNKFLAELGNYISISDQISLKDALLDGLSELSLSGSSLFRESIDPNAEKVKVLTIHASKGLEFQYVYISGVNNGLIPLHYDNNKGDVEEEKRLFFVAVTRAKDYLEMSYHTKPEGWNSFPEPSKFLKYLPPELIMQGKPKESKPIEKVKIPDQSEPYSEWQIGQKIKHPRYGSGSITRIMGGNIFCTFGQLGEKSFSINFLPLTLDES